MSDPVRWAILAPGNIANRMAEALTVVADAELVGVASRSPERAAAFAAKHGIARTFATYEELAASPDVDVVYVASPHPFHAAQSALCLRAGKAVVCEKPLTCNAGEARQLVAVAHEHHAFLMEAMWTRFIPASVQVRKWLDEGAIGEPRYLYADFGFRAGWDPEGRLLNAALAGGGLLDVGVYPVAYAHWVFGAAPKRVVAAGVVGETGVDEQVAMTLGFPGGGLANLACAVRTTTPHTAVICGTEGQIHAPLFWRGQEVKLVRGREETRIQTPFDKNGFEYEAREVTRCLREGCCESPGIPLAESLAIQETMDECRRQIGLVYPFEHGGR